MSNPNPAMILYTGQSPNGIKISIALEELGLPYTVRKLDFVAHEQKSEWFTAINPNGRIPAITDQTDDGHAIHVWESGAVLQYLVDRYDGAEQRISYARGTREWVQMTCWLHFQMAGVGPMQGQANHFARYSEQDSPYARHRYLGETRRLYGIMDAHLSTNSSSRYFVGDKCTIADIAIWGWVSVSKWCGIELAEEFPALAAWEERMLERPALEKGRHVPEPHHREMLKGGEEGIRAFEERARAFVKAAYKDKTDEC
ncbi:theta class glutathione S-transferase [Polychaeton citri CBS 116435]|uniref:Theta class glutathione S-transferase n=1 Tax=Polychaeton citri CBS 116435 TaxID=1314669 RepID=A0A9P4Q7U0_9PEZI|nr:theta class glutathione S-transferase [Polychaeton citri CBS 116435]